MIRNLMERFFKRNFYLFIGLLLSIAGLASQYSVASGRPMMMETVFYKQLVFILVAVIVFFIVSNIDYHIWKGLILPLYGVSVALLVIVLFFGSVRYGARRWLEIGPITFQPSELAKVVYIFFLAQLFQQSQKITAKTFFWAGVGTLLPFVLILKQPDLGTALVLLPILFSGLWMVGVSIWFFASCGIAGLVMSPIFWLLLKDYQKMRIYTFLNPDIDPLGAGYSINQARIAIGSGGLFGKGWLKGTQNILDFLPERHTDFIFSTFAEEFGFLGAAALIYLFYILVSSLLKTSRKAVDRFGRFVAAFIAVYLGFHVIVNIAMNCGFAPVVGIPLPFVSYGGTSFLINFFLLGIAQNIENNN